MIRVSGSGLRRKKAGGGPGAVRRGSPVLAADYVLQRIHRGLDTGFYDSETVSSPISRNINITVIAILITIL